MAQLLWIVQGKYKDRRILMRNVDADIARNHHFGYNRMPDWTIPLSLVQEALGQFDPASDQQALRDWEDRVSDPAYVPQDPGPPPAPQPPTGINLNPSQIKRDRPVGTVVGLLTAVDANQQEGHKFITSDTNFRIGGMNGNQVIVLKRPGPNPGPYDMVITTTDLEGLTYTGTVVITVTSLAEKEQDNV